MILWQIIFDTIGSSDPIPTIVIIGTIFLFVPIAIIGSKKFLFWSGLLTDLIPLEQNDPVMLLELILLDRIIDMVDSIGSTIY